MGYIFYCGKNKYHTSTYFYSSKSRLVIASVNVKNSSRSGTFEELYGDPLRDINCDGKVCKLRRALYRLKQSLSSMVWKALNFWEEVFKKYGYYKRLVK